MRVHTKREPGGGRPVPSMVLTCRHELSSVEVAQVLVRAAREGRVRPGVGPTIGTDLPRPATETLLRAALHDLGARTRTGWDAESDGVWGLDDTGHAVRWAAGQILRLWPALSDQALARFVAGYAPPLLQTLNPPRSDHPGRPDRSVRADAGGE